MVRREEKGGREDSHRSPPTNPCRSAAPTAQPPPRATATQVSVAGGVIFAGAMVIMLWGEVLWNFTAGMMLVGLAWNFLFSSATVLLTSCYEPCDAIRVQGINDVFIFGLAGCGK